MEYIYAALLLDAAGKEINEENMSSVIKAAGVAPDAAQVKSTVNALKSVNIKDVVKNAQNVSVAAPAAAAPAAGAKKEEKDEKKEEEAAAGGLASLFG